MVLHMNFWFCTQTIHENPALATNATNATNASIQQARHTQHKNISEALKTSAAKAGRVTTGFLNKNGGDMALFCGKVRIIQDSFLTQTFT
jgi:hypothetical protein